MDSDFQSQPKQGEQEQPNQPNVLNRQTHEVHVEEHEIEQDTQKKKNEIQKDEESEKIKERKQAALLEVAAVEGYAFSEFLQTQPKQGEQELSQLNVLDISKVITIFKEIKKEFYTVFQNFAAISQNIKQQTMGRAKPTEIKMMLIEQPMFRGEIETIQQQVYDKYGTNKREFEYACSHTYKEDPKVKQLSRDMKGTFDRAFQGLAPDSKTDIPAFLTPELTIEILEKIMTESTIKLNEKLLELQEAGEHISYNNPKMMEVMQTLKMDSSKKDVLKQYNLDVYDASGSQILQFATQTYTKSNQDKMNKLDIKYQSIMEVLLTQGAMSNQDLQQRLRQEPKRAPGGMFGFPAADHQQFEPEIQQENDDQFANNEEPKQDGPAQLKVEENQPEKQEQHDQPPQGQGQPQGQIHEVEHIEKHEVEHIEKHEVEHVEKHEQQDAQQKDHDPLIVSVDDQSEKFQSVIQN